MVQTKTNKVEGKYNNTVVVERFHILQGPAVQAYCDVTINGLITVYGCKVLKNKKGELYVALPTYESNNGKFYHHVKTANKNFWLEFQKSILHQYQIELEKGSINRNT